MMKFSAFFVLALLTSSMLAGAQESDTSRSANDKRSNSFEFSIGVSGNYAMHDVDFDALPPVENCCLGFENTNAIGYGAFVGASMPLTDDGLRLYLRTGYSQLPATFSSFSTNRVYVPGQGSANAVFEHKLDVTFHAIPIDLLFEYKVLESVWIGLGAEGYVVASAAFAQTETLQEPTSLTFENGSRIRIDTSGNLSGYNSLVLNGIASLRFRLVENLSAISGIDLLLGYVHPFTSVYDPLKWTGAGGNPPRSYYINKYNISMFTAGLMFAF